MFEARDFLIRDGDTLYVTEAPFTQWSKTIGSITGTANQANNLSTALGG
jgi:polysaccharide export outer membrane protein